jgi:hypothetical protein
VLKIGSAPYIAFAGSVAIGAAFALIYRLHNGQTLAYFGSEIGTPGGFLGMGGVGMLGARLVWAHGEDRQKCLRNFRDAILIPSLCIGSMIAVSIAAYWTPITYDSIVYDFDLKFGRLPAGWWGQSSARKHGYFR